MVFLGLLPIALLSSSPDKRLSLDPSGFLTRKSFFQFLTHSLNTTSFHLDKPIWMSKTPSRVKSFIWTAVLNKINTNDILQVQRPHKAISPDVCVMCGVNTESVSHLFLHFPMVDFLWNTLFDIFGECWKCPTTLDQFLSTSFAGFERRKEAKSLWHFAIYATVWGIWLERNSHIFNDKFSNMQVCGNGLRHLAFI